MFPMSHIKYEEHNIIKVINEHRYEKRKYSYSTQVLYV